MANATLISVEEPELNLRYSLQERLREVLTNIVGQSGGPSQIFLTSHSPAFESGPRFYYMKPTPDGPVVEQHEITEALAAVDFPTAVTPPQHRAVRSYLSTDGVVRLPERVMKSIGLPQGGGVVFVDHDQSIEIMSNERFIDELGIEGEQAEAAPGQRCSATVDWLIAGQALKAGWILVTGDKGPEFRGLDRKITLDKLEALLREMLAARGEHAPSGT